jgi:ferredoxin
VSEPRSPGPPSTSSGPAQGPVLSKRSRVTIEVDRELCFGFGDCVDSAPGVFELDEESKSMVVDPDAQDLDSLLLAAQDCPVDAIFVVDAETGEQLYP